MPYLIKAGKIEHSVNLPMAEILVLQGVQRIH
jgi:hypothetical protein